MTEREANEILDLAESSSRPITLEQAAARLDAGSPRGAARRIGAAYSYFENTGDMASAKIIAKSFVDRNGEYPWY